MLIKCSKATIRFQEGALARTQIAKRNLNQKMSTKGPMILNNIHRRRHSDAKVTAGPLHPFQNSRIVFRDGLT